MKADPQWVRDSLVADAVEPAKAAGKEVNVRAVEDYMVETLRKLERKNAEAKPKTSPVQERDDEDQVRKEFRKATGREMPDVYVERGGQRKERPIVTMSEIERVGRQRLAERLRWIKARPDLYEKVKGMVVALHSSKPEHRERAAQKLREFIAMTDRLAGHDWRKPKPQNLWFG